MSLRILLGKKECKNYFTISDTQILQNFMPQQVIQRGIDEMPQHRCLVQVNPKLCKEEAYLVRREWETFVDKEGYLRPKAILEWFNRGNTRGEALCSG